MEPKLRRLLESLYRNRGQFYNLSWDSSEFLHWLVGTRRPKRILEIGGANGFSAIWMAHALKENRVPGKIISIEYDLNKFSLAKRNLAAANLSRFVENRFGDAYEIIPSLKGKFDLVLLDAWKNDYLPFFRLFYPILSKDGLIVADNAIGLAPDMMDYLKAVRAHPKLESVLLPLGEGLEVTRKK